MVRGDEIARFQKDLQLLTDLQPTLIRLLRGTANAKCLMGTIAQKAGEVLKASGSAILMKDPSGPPEGPPTLFVGYGCCGLDAVPPEADLDRSVWQTGSAYLARTHEELVRHSQPALLPGESGELGIQSYLAMPIHGEAGRLIGLIKAVRRMGDEPLALAEPFTEQDALVLDTLARFAGRCEVYARFAQDDRRLEAASAWARNVIAQAAATAEGLDRFLDVVAQVLAAVMQSDSCGIFLLEDRDFMWEGQTLNQHGGFGPSQVIKGGSRAYLWPDREKMGACRRCECCDPANCPQSPIPREQKVGITPWIAATGRSFYAQNWDDLKKHPHWRGEFDWLNFPESEEMQCGAFFGTPFRLGDDVCGVIKAENSALKGGGDTRDFSRESREALTALAQDVALGIERVRNSIEARYEIMRSAEEQYTRIFQQPGLNVPKLVKEIESIAKGLFHAEKCAIFLKGGNRLVSDGREYEFVSEAQIVSKPSETEKKGITGWIAATRNKFTARSNQEFLKHPHHLGKYDYLERPDFKTHSFMGFPLVAQGEGGEPELVGVLKVENKTLDRGGVKIVTYFSELDERTCELVANSAALAIQNARLMEARHNIEINALGRAAAMFAKQLGEVLPIVNAKLTSLIERHAFLVREELESKTRQAHDLLNYLSAIKESLLALKHDLGLPAETLQTVLNLVAEADTIVLKLCDYLLPHSREHSRDRGRPPHTPPLPDDLHNAQEYLERAQQIVEEFGSFATESFTLPDIVAPRELVDDLVIHVKAALGAGATVCKSQSAQGIGSIPVNLRSLKSVFMHLARDSRCLKSHGLVVTISAHDASDEDLRRVRLRSDDRYLKLVYADNGPGVRQDHKAIIFYPRTSIREGGSGLGLAIAARVARAHGGCVVENGKPRPEGAQGDDYGARFEFYLGGGQTL